MKKSISKKIIQLNVLTVLLALIFMAIISSVSINRYILKGISEDLLHELRLFIKMTGYEVDKEALDSQELKERLRARVQTRMASIEFESETMILVNLPRGWKQIYASSTDARLTTEEIEEIRTKVTKPRGYFTVSINGENSLAVVMPIKQIQYNSNNFEGVIIAYIPMTQINEINKGIIRVLLISTIVIGIISTLIGWTLSKKITNPIIQLIKTTEKLSKRDFSNKINIKTDDEIEELAFSINKMADSIYEYDTNQKTLFQNISHELKTPLMSIQGYAEGLKENMFDDKEQALNVIIDESKRIKKYVEDIIYYSKLDMVDEFFTFEYVNINQIIIKAIEKVESIAILNDIDILFTPANDCKLYVDEEKFIQALINILSNCLKYTTDMIQIDTSSDNDLYSIMIKDNGKGFNEDDLTKIFDRFYKGEKEGSGLGMTIVKKIIDKHKGEIFVKNNESGGALFIIKLPIKK